MASGKGEDVRWTARWIWAADAPPANAYVYLRKDFELPERPTSAVAHVSADTWYRLYVNGSYVGRGPSRSGRERKHYDSLDIAPCLRRGRNVIAAVGHYLGVGTHFGVPVRAGFLLQAEVKLPAGRVVNLATDGSWRALVSPAWDAGSARIFFPLGFQEVFDAREEPEGWLDVGFDDSSWPQASVGDVAPAPWKVMLPRGVPQERETAVFPSEVLWVGEAQDAGRLWHLDFKALLGGRDNCCAYAHTFVRVPRAVRAELALGGEDAVRAWVDGELVVDATTVAGKGPQALRVGVDLHEGWNSLLVKVAAHTGKWEAYVSVATDEPLDVAFSPYKDDGRDVAWRVIGPFADKVRPGGDVALGLLRTPFPPEGRLADSYAGGAFVWKDVSVAESADRDIAREIASLLPQALDRCVVRRPDALLRDDDSATFVRTRPGASALILIDFGRELTGYPRIRVDGPAGAVIDATYTEMLTADGWIDPLYDGVHYGDRYILKDGRQEHEVFAKRAFRYMLLRVRNCPGGLSIESVSENFSTYPVQLRGSFSCSDERLNAIWEVGPHTLSLCMEDAYLDCPRRERGQWWGDARVEALCNYYCFGDAALVRRGIRQMAEVSSDEGLTPCLYPAGGVGFIPGFSLYWIMSLRDYCLFTGDLQLARELLPRVGRVLAAFEGWRGRNGLLRPGLPYWWFFDWSGYYGHVEWMEGESALANMTYAEALRAASQVASWAGDGSSAERYAASYEALKVACEAFWSADLGTYVDFVPQGDHPKLSRHVAAWAIISDVAPRERWDGILDAAFDESRHVLAEGTPYFAFYVLQALEKAGRYDQAVAFIRGNWGRLLDQGATTWWEHWRKENSLCHAWSSGPTYHLPAVLLGVRPLEPGFAEFAVEPHIAGLSYARGVVPTPKGGISVWWDVSDEAFRIRVGVPEGCKARLKLPDPPWEGKGVSWEGRVRPDESGGFVLDGSALVVLRREAP